MSKIGNLLFAKYAFAPNKLKYCGPDDNRAIFDYCVAQQSDQGLVELLKGFEGAYPYLQIIARANKIKDPFDEKVVEAYWIGNNLLKNVSVDDFYDSLKNRFGKKINSKSMKWLLTKPPIGAKPHHSFHVLDVYTKTGLIRSGIKTNVLETINNCLIMWGRVNRVTCNIKHVTQVSIEYNPIILKKGKLIFGKYTTKNIQPIFTQPKVGDIVSFHWGNVCDILTEYQVKNLKNWTNYHLQIANHTM
ncbi:hypothetical protein A3F08_02285 [Candidatus Berkelbacteria bacterium RIFCSPHIGHO2_12_FULL_36_9]|uniref:Uncharacterized protein n=1 Tax=Candidatus Berkelbacteria bacterium RIFCSPHIGHO2_12_FULL_36_9 TaxID=1797469 RepID=A0A1F5EH27_9BACT|nr:MAG: hypothetical protein A3F08_02285 [Candidatus Berkelbacteria bacterium RIFCSPHIGHO2_12_FULL_36_9]